MTDMQNLAKKFPLFATPLPAPLGGAFWQTLISKHLGSPP